MSTVQAPVSQPPARSHWTPRYLVNRTRQMLYERSHHDDPWLTPAAIRLLTGLLCPADLGAEFGSGRSTLWFAARGAWHDLYETLFVFTPHYTRLGWEDATVPGMVYLAVEEWLIDLSGPNAVGVLAALILPPLASREREGVLHVLLVIAFQLVGVAMQGKFFPYLSSN